MATNSPSVSTNWQLVVFVSMLVFVAIILFDRPASEAKTHEAESEFTGSAFLSGMHRKIDSQNFRRGEASAFLGGVEIDLRNAEMGQDEAVLDVSSMMAGVKIRVPSTWTVVSRVDTVLSGYKDDTHRPADSGKKLILKGSLFMSGVKIEN